MATFSEEFYDADFVGIPCEFCEELFPFELLIEHQSGCRPDLAHFQPSDDEPIEQPTQIISSTKNTTNATNTVKDAPVKETESTILSSFLSNEVSIAKEKLLSKETSAVKEAPQLNSLSKQKDAEMLIKEKIRKDLQSKSLIKDILASEEPTITFEDSMIQDKGSKLMAYGSGLNKNKIEEEKPSFKAPSLPLLNNADDRESENVCNNLSDSDDAGESLEDFWKKAEIQLSRRFKKKINI